MPPTLTHSHAANHNHTEMFLRNNINQLATLTLGLSYKALTGKEILLTLKEVNATKKQKLVTTFLLTLIATSNVIWLLENNDV